jgi:hypothetical protein
MLLTKMLVITTKNLRLITSHSCHQISILFNRAYEGCSSLYWIPKLHKNLWSTKEWIINMANILSAVKGRLQSYCDTVYSFSNFNQVWILKYREDLLDCFNPRFYSRKFHLSKNLLLQFSNHFSWKSINAFKEIIYNTINWKATLEIYNFRS